LTLSNIPYCCCFSTELVAMAKSWTIVGKDLLSVVSCKEPYEWRQGTDAEWEFEPKVKNGAAKSNQFHVSEMQE
jgi:carbamoyl-phosphate synthase small subunit